VPLRFLQGEKGKAVSGLQGQSTLSDAEKYTECVKHVNYLLDFVEQMQDRERKFIEDLSDRMDRFGGKTQISNKQLFWLRDLVLKY
jgi:hypothetical protein